LVRLSDYDPEERRHLRDLPCPTFPTTPFVRPPELRQARIAIVSTAGLQRRGDTPFAIGDGGYRIIPATSAAGELVMSHISTNFDRTGFQMDVNMVLPLDRLRELADDGIIGSVGAYHYSFMGATEPTRMEKSARAVAKLLKGDAVDVVLLVPV
jgi:D-proline reductase (dithiol) PrdB